MDNKNRVLRIWQEVNRPGIPDLISYLETSDFFTAPCSKEHHLAVPGGLAEHSLNVYDLLSEKCSRFSRSANFPFIATESIIICALAHDFCKINYYKPGGEPCSDKQFDYLNSLWWNKKGLNANLNGAQILKLFDSKGQFNRNIPGNQASILIEWLKNRPNDPFPELPESSWSYEDKFPLGHGEKSVIILQQFIKLSLIEMLAIRWHMGAFDVSDYYGKWAYSEASRVSPLVTLLHTSDMEATHVLEV